MPVPDWLVHARTHRRPVGGLLCTCGGGLARTLPVPDWLVHIGRGVGGLLCTLGWCGPCRCRTRR